MAKRLEGNTATLNESAFSGYIIKLSDCGDGVEVQYYRPNMEETIYEEPVTYEVEYFSIDNFGDELEEPEAGFKIGETIYLLSEFMRDNYMEGVR